MIINICLIIVIIITGTILITYNRFVRENNRVKQKESDIDVLLNQRFDLLPNLIETVKGYSKYENNTLKELTKLRSSYNDNNFSVNEANKIDKSFGKLMVTLEKYPELKANANFLDLQSNLKEIEESLSIARINYNRSVIKFNNLVESIPSNIIAKIFDFEKKDFFKLDNDKKDNIKVDFPE
ncbi:MAG: LemA family protein [bacterium]|nr:LemA family protein [bacterium]